MSELISVLLISTVAKNIVNVLKMLRKQEERLNAVWLLLSGGFGVLLIWWLQFDINVFKSMGVETTTRVSLANGFLIGIMGQDIYKIMKLVQQKTPKARPE